MLTIFGHLGHVALEAASGLEAIAILEAQPNLHAMLLDLNMTPMDGFDVLKRVREQPQTRDLPIICISAHARQEDQDLALQTGANGYIVKPFRRRELIAALDAVLVQVGTLLPGQSIAPA